MGFCCRRRTNLGWFGYSLFNNVSFSFPLQEPFPFSVSIQSTTKYRTYNNVSVYKRIHVYNCVSVSVHRDKEGGGGKRKMKINDICYVFRHILPASSVVCVYFPHWKSSNIEWDLWRQLTRRKKRKPVTSIFFHLMENTQVKRKMQSICLVGGKETILHIIIFNFEFSIPSAFELKCSHCCWFWSITYSVYE